MTTTAGPTTTTPAPDSNGFFYQWYSTNSAGDNDRATTAEDLIGYGWFELNGQTSSYLTKTIVPCDGLSFYRCKVSHISPNVEDVLSNAVSITGGVIWNLDNLYSNNNINFLENHNYYSPSVSISGLEPNGTYAVNYLFASLLSGSSWYSSAVPYPDVTDLFIMSTQEFTADSNGEWYTSLMSYTSNIDYSAGGPGYQAIAIAQKTNCPRGGLVVSSPLYSDIIEFPIMSS